MKGAPNTAVRLTLERAYWQVASDCDRRTPTLGQC